MKIKESELVALQNHFKQWQEIQRNFQNLAEPIQKAQKQLQESLQPIIESQKTAQKALEPIIKQQEMVKKHMQSVVLPKINIPNLSAITKQSQAFQKALNELISPAFRNFQKSLKELPPRTREALLVLGRHGWYLDLEIPMPGLWRLEKALSEGEVTEAEEALVEYFEKRLDQIENSIIERFPDRKKLINAAFKAHRREEYELSIPVLLAQTDGICKEVSDEYFFMKRNKKPHTSRYVEQFVANTFKAALLSPLSQSLPIGASEYQRDEDFDELNRHMVLHGESLDYGSKENGLKAVSLINYVAHVLDTRDDTDST